MNNSIEANAVIAVFNEGVYMTKDEYDEKTKRGELQRGYALSVDSEHIMDLSQDPTCVASKANSNAGMYCYSNVLLVLL